MAQFAAVTHMKMKDLSGEQYAALPALGSQDRVIGMKTIFVHTGLKGSPVSIVTATGLQTEPST